MWYEALCPVNRGLYPHAERRKLTDSTERTAGDGHRGSRPHAVDGDEWETVAGTADTNYVVGVETTALGTQ
jgi:hypothetical protein